MQRIGGRIVGWIQDYPATSAIVFVALAVGAATGALWTDVSNDKDLYDAVAYGLPPLRDGRWWTFFSGAFFVPELVLYVPVLLLVIVAASTYERRVGHWQTLVLVVGGQAAGAIVTALILWPFRDSGWTWAVTLGRAVDVGISAGGFAVLGALTAVMQPVWRTRLRVGVTAYLFAMVLRSGLLWDVEHFAAWLLGMMTGPFFAGRRPAFPKVQFGPRTQRAVVALILAVLAISTLVEAVFPGNGGPFNDGRQPFVASHVSLALVVTALLELALADGLRRGRRIAWWVVTGLVALTVLALIGLKASAERNAELVIYGTQLVLLLATYRAFGVRTRQSAFRHAGRRIALVALLLFLYTAIGFAVLKDDFVPAADPADMVSEFVARIFFSSSDNVTPVTTAAEWFTRSIGWVWLGALLLTLLGLIYQSRRPHPPAEAEDSRLRDLLRRHNSSSIEWMLTWEGNTLWFTPDGGTVIGYRVVGSVALCLADPVGPSEQRLDALHRFDQFCFDRGWIPCLFAAGQESADLAPQLRWKAVQVAEDSLVDLPDLEFKGKAWQDVRTALNKAGKEDIRLEVVRWADARPPVTDQLRAISSGWVADKALPEMGFTLGGLAEADDPEVRLHLARRDDGTIEGFTSWMPIQEDGAIVGWTVDLMRRRDEG
ncbi:MAG: bifunctional lysylphosphatidylglycerol flippase/synthetase MprF, partial [Acidimicrobiales bacterium]